MDLGDWWLLSSCHVQSFIGNDQNQIQTITTKTSTSWSHRKHMLLDSLHVKALTRDTLKKVNNYELVFSMINFSKNPLIFHCKMHKVKHKKTRKKLVLAVKVLNIVKVEFRFGNEWIILLKFIVTVQTVCLRFLLLFFPFQWILD